MAEFSQRLKEIRKASGKKQREVAEFLNIKLRTYQGYEMQETEPSIQKLIALADCFDVTLDYLVGRTDE